MDTPTESANHSVLSTPRSLTESTIQQTFLNQNLPILSDTDDEYGDEDNLLNNPDYSGRTHNNLKEIRDYYNLVVKSKNTIPIERNMEEDLELELDLDLALDPKLLAILTGEEFKNMLLKSIQRSISLTVQGTVAPIVEEVAEVKSQANTNPENTHRSTKD